MDHAALAVETPFWSRLAVQEPSRVACIRELMTQAEARRALADYDTGSITEAEALALHALAEHVRARTILEVGTFIGTSTMALAMAPGVESVFTCDASNACLESTAVVRAYPKQRSMDMLRDLRRRGVRADLCFFDGVLTPDDVTLLVHVTHHQTVYAVHDYTHGPKVRIKGGRCYTEVVPRKGVGNARLLAPHVPAHRLIAPFEGSTLALMLPEAWL